MFQHECLSDTQWVTHQYVLSIHGNEQYANYTEDNYLVSKAICAAASKEDCKNKDPV